MFLPVYCLHAQDLTPGPPVLHSADIIPGTDSLSVSWKLSDSNNVAYYCVYTNYGKGWIKLDSTGNASDTQLVFKFPAILLGSQRVCLAAVPVTGNFNSPLSNEHSTNFLECRFDSCSMNIHMQWTGYSGWGASLSGYLVYRRQPGKFNELLASLPASSLQYSFKAEAGMDYCLWVQATSSKGFQAASTLSCLNTSVPRPPAWINADQAVVMPDRSVQLQFSIDPLAESHTYTLLGAPAASGPFDSITGMAATDEKLLVIRAPALNTFPYWYKLWAVNTCADSLVSSGTAVAMATQVSISGEQVQVEWTPYENWPYGVNTYSVYRVVSGSPPEKVGETSGIVTTFDEALSTLIALHIKGGLCYYVEASENPGNPYGISGLSRSASGCIALETRFVVPDGFTPDGDGVNDEFAAVFSFYPSDYSLVVSTLSGKLLFQTTRVDEPWTGKGADGRVMPPGAYAWSLRFTDFQGRSVSKKGLVTLFLP
ncbi:MAG: gliding motility-associated C-terminal domain-containing protein [Bacteroidales bacterium]